MGQWQLKEQRSKLLAHIEANTDTVAPPSTQLGIVVKSEENLGISPAIKRIPAAIAKTLFATTFVEETIPTFWLNVAVGRPPNSATTIFGRSPVVLATIVAIVLNLILPREKDDKAIEIMKKEGAG